jgi:hypothetical protein
MADDMIRPVTISAQWTCREQSWWNDPTDGGHAALQFADGAELVGSIDWSSVIKTPGANVLWVIMITRPNTPVRTVWRRFQEASDTTDEGKFLDKTIDLPGTVVLAPGSRLWVGFESDNVPQVGEEECPSFEVQVTFWIRESDPPVTVERYERIGTAEGAWVAE